LSELFDDASTVRGFLMSKKKKRIKETQARQQVLTAQNKHPPLVLRLKYDAAQTTPENARHWSMADGLSADASMTPEVRRTVHNRARYEIACNSYAKGMALSIASDCIGTGPRLQILSDDDKFSTTVETEFTAWAEAVRLGEKLQTMRMIFRTIPQFESV